MSEMTQRLGLRIRRLRNDRHMSQEELAFKAGISPAHLGQIERAVKNPTVETVARIAGALDVDLAALFASTTSPTPAKNVTVEKILAHLESMSESEQKDILRIVRIFRNYGK